MQYLLPGSELFSPLLQLQAVFLIQLLQFLGLVFNQQVAFLILTHTNTRLLKVRHNQQNASSCGRRCSDAPVLAAAEARGRWRRTATAGLSSGFHASEVDVISHSSASSLPGLQTGERH